MSTTAVAQTATDSIMPRAGTWGAEAGDNSSAALLHFSSPRAAWLLRGSFAISRETQDQSPVFGSSVTSVTNTMSNVTVQVGRRWWSGEPNARLRPLTGLGLTGLYSSASTSHGGGGGAYGELGATYFFSPHVSLGAASELDVRYFRSRYGLTPTELKSSAWQLSGNLVNLTAAVYF